MKDYTVKRQKVQNALMGLVFGYPHGGVELPLPNYKLYEGPNHIHLGLKGRYFEWLPNPYYYDVLIDTERLN